ncbi:MAG: hypothetical protein AABX29_08915 [Nanoarchaeota archaeon]
MERGSVPTPEELTDKEAFPVPKELTDMVARDFYISSMRSHLNLYGSRDVVPFNGCPKYLDYKERFLLINRWNIYEGALKLQRNPATVVV